MVCAFSRVRPSSAPPNIHSFIHTYMIHSPGRAECVSDSVRRMSEVLGPVDDRSSAPRGVLTPPWL